MFTVVRRPMSRALSLALCAFSLSPFQPDRASAQSSVEIRLRLFAGSSNPRGDVVDAAILSSPTNIVTYDEIGSQPAFGLGVELRRPGAPGAIRLSASRGLHREEVGRWGCAPGLDCPSILIEIPTEIATTIVMTDLVGDVEFGGITLHPLVGLAWVRYGYDWDPTTVGAFSLEPGSHSADSAALHFGVGASVSLNELTLEVEYGEYRLRENGPHPDQLGAVIAGISVPIG